MGIWSEHACGYGSAGDVALMFMAFGDALLPKSSFEVNPQEKPTAKINPNYGQVFNDMIKEMEKVHGLVEKVQMSLYTKTYPYRQSEVQQSRKREKKGLKEQPAGQTAREKAS